MRSREKTAHTRELAERASCRLSYRLRREHYAKMSELAAAERAETEMPSLKRTLAERDQQIAKLTADNATLRDLALRARADLDNARKRFQREKAETIKYAAEQILRELIPVADNLERALASANGGADAKAVHDGVQMVLDQFVGVLRNNGLEAIASDGQQFNPHFHEAVGTEEGENVVDNQIVTTLQKGYMLRERVVRPAMVRVGRALRPAAAPVEATQPLSAPPEEAAAVAEDVTQGQTESANESKSDDEPKSDSSGPSTEK